MTRTVVKWTDARDAALKAARIDQGLSFAEIATALNKRFGMSITDKQATKRFNLITKQHEARKEIDAKLLLPAAEATMGEHLAAGCSLTDDNASRGIPEPDVRPGHKEAFVAASGQRTVSIFELRQRDCRWPYRCDDGTTRYCGADRRQGPYCAAHHRLSLPAAARSVGDRDADRAAARVERVAA